MKRLIALTTAVLFVLSTTVPANAAFTSDQARILNAEADLETGIADLKAMPAPQLKKTSDGSNVSGSTISWTYDATKTWKVANQYIEVSYQANLPGWGIQIYCDNKNGNPAWTENPPDTGNFRVDSPAGLIGSAADNVNFIAIPMAWKAFPGGDFGKPQYSDGSGFNASTEYRTYYTEPKEKAFGDPATDNYYIELYQYSPDASAATPDLYGKYSFLIDKGAQKWIDADNDNTIDPRTGTSNALFVDADSDGTVDAGEGEITSVFEDNDGSVEASDSAPKGQDGITVVNYLGTNTCTMDSTGTFFFRDAATSPVYVVLAAKIAVGTIKSTYSTNTLTLELYHE